MCHGFGPAGGAWGMQYCGNLARARTNLRIIHTSYIVGIRIDSIRPEIFSCSYDIFNPQLIQRLIHRGTWPLHTQYAYRHLGLDTFQNDPNCLPIGFKTNPHAGERIIDDASRWIVQGAWFCGYYWCLPPPFYFKMQLTESVEKKIKSIFSRWFYRDCCGENQKDEMRSVAVNPQRYCYTTKEFSAISAVFLLWDQCTASRSRLNAQMLTEEMAKPQGSRHGIIYIESHP